MHKHQHDIERYLRGELSPAEMHALEKKALTDPFLADALEGADVVSSDDFSDDLAALQQKLEKRVGTAVVKRGVAWQWPMRIAAGLVLLVVASYFVWQWSASDSGREKYLALQNETSPSISSSPDSAQLQVLEEKSELSTKETMPAEKPDAKPEPIQPLKQGKSDALAGQLAQADDEVLVMPSTKDVAAAETQPSARDAEFPEVEIAKADAPVSSPASSSEDVKTGSTRAKKSVAAAPSAQAELRDKGMRVVYGRVRDAIDKQPLPGVNILVPNTANGTVSDAEGRFKITVTGSDERLIVSFVGYETAMVTLNELNEVEITLQHDIASLSEVVVVGYGVSSSEDVSPTLETAIPNGGRKAFKQYLENNLRYPEVALENNVEGKVTVQFTVEPSGSLSEFKVLKGIGYGCDEEVIRLIKAGPTWTPTKKNNQPVRDQVKVRMKFTLPKK